MEDAASFWERFIEDENEDGYPSIFSRQYYLERFKTKEQYVKEMGRTIPYAFITPDGEWHAPGKMGWFACSDETAEDNDRYTDEWDAYLRSDSNPYVSIVDCHV